MIYISNERIINDKIYYNSEPKMNQRIFKKWKIKQQYKEFYRLFAEGLLLITAMTFCMMSLYIWFY